MPSCVTEPPVAYIGPALEELLAELDEPELLELDELLELEELELELLELEELKDSELDELLDSAGSLTYGVNGASGTMNEVV